MCAPLPRTGCACAIGSFPTSTQWTLAPTGEGLALCEPLYYAYPEAEEAYDKAYCNGYLFGSQLLVYPITSPQKKQLGMGAVDAWIPPGRWTDLFTGAVYTRPPVPDPSPRIDGMPVLQPAQSYR